MADFKTHISTSTVVGVGYGAIGYACGIPAPACFLSAGLCSISGMLPDLDSDTGIPLRESVLFGSAVIPMLMVDRFQQLGFGSEMMVLLAGLIYLVIRFVVAEAFRRYTVHRGMWHSIPAAVTVGLLAYLIVAGDEFHIRVFKAASVFTGFMVHLILDEIWSFEWTGRKLRIKRSFGTALKFYSKKTWANISTYGKLIAIIVLLVGDESYFAEYRDSAKQLRTTVRDGAKSVATNIIEEGAKVLR